FFAIPIPSAILARTIAVLQSGSADMAYVLVKLSGTPVYRQGFLFAMPDLVVEVAPACSGIRSSVAILLASLIAGHLFLRSSWRKIVLLIVALPLLLFKNAVRIAVLCLLTVHYDPRILASRLHQEGGIPTFMFGLILLYPVLMMLVKSENIQGYGRNTFSAAVR